MHLIAVLSAGPIKRVQLAKNRQSDCHSAAIRAAGSSATLLNDSGRLQKKVQGRQARTTKNQKKPND